LGDLGGREGNSIEKLLLTDDLIDKDKEVILL
jgi:hypothetical protein